MSYLPAASNACSDLSTFEPLCKRRDLSPTDVVEAQLDAFSTGDLDTIGQFASGSNRRGLGTRGGEPKESPYNILIGNSKHEILSGLSHGPDRFTCRVRVQPSKVALTCLDRDATVELGQRVRVSSDALHVKRCFDAVQYQYSELMESMRGQEFEVICHARENQATNIVGLPSPDGSQDGVWYFPVTVLERPKATDPSDVSASPPEPASSAREPQWHEYRWQLRRQSEQAITFELGDVVVHVSQGYRGVVVGYDDACQQTEAWVEAMGVESLPGGRGQPFYHLLVDSRDRPGDKITYVAQESVQRPGEGGTPRAWALRGMRPGGVGEVAEAVRHRMLADLLKPQSFDAERCSYDPVPELRDLYPQNVEGCWMVDSVSPDEPAV